MPTNCLSRTPLLWLALPLSLLSQAGCGGASSPPPPVTAPAPPAVAPAAPPQAAAATASINVAGSGCDKAGTFSFGGMTFFAVGSKTHGYMALLPQASDWQAQCNLLDQGNGAMGLAHVTSLSAHLDASLLSFAPGKVVAPRDYLEGIFTNVEAGMKQKLGASVRNKRYVGAPDQPVLEYDVAAKAPSGQTLQVTELWMMRQRRDLRVIELHLTVLSDDAAVVGEVEKGLVMPSTLKILEN